ncbi:hypothetical protein ANN_27456 [Periplaneta americana]|uniref:NACHT domain-containing protein n=1 Tax=Periplaneta americana TaxID=6978 RepID=A0ABQ8RVX5_PERAM|nr:hypothetical protein ANN_27456 [Periplaneta americana]
MIASENPISQTSYNGWRDHRANHAIPPCWLDDRPPLLRHVDVRPAAGCHTVTLSLSSSSVETAAIQAMSSCLGTVGSRSSEVMTIRQMKTPTGIDAGLFDCMSQYATEHCRRTRQPQNSTCHVVCSELFATYMLLSTSMINNNDGGSGCGGGGDSVSSAYSLCIDLLQDYEKTIGQQLPESGGLLSVQNSNVLTCLKVHQSIEKKILVDANLLEERMSEVLALWGLWPGCDVLVIDGWVETMEKITHNLGSGNTLVLIHDSEKGRELNSLSHKDEFRFGQLNEESRKQILDCKINFQGDFIKLNKLVDNTAFDKIANAEILTQIFSGVAETIGDKLTQQNEHYIPRTLFSRAHVNETIFSDDRDCLVVSGVSLQALSKVVHHRREVEMFDEKKHSEGGLCRCFVIRGREDFDKAKNVFERVHWIHKEETDFIWKESKGNVSYIKSHLMDVTSIRSLQEVMLLSDKIKLLVAYPGMGKSTEILNLAQEFKRHDPACWVVTVVLNEHTDYLSKCGDSAVELLLQAGKFTSDFATSLFKHELYHGGNIVILVDGFDEISPDYAGKVLHMLEQLIMECKFKQLWITSRTLMKDTLEEKFSCLSFELQPFTKQDQRDFLAKLWNDINVGQYDLDIFITNLLEVTGNSLSDKLGQFTEIPLQTFMLAEVFSSEASNFVSHKGRLDVPITNLVQLESLQLQKKEYEKDHMACAVHALLKTADFNKLHFSSDVMSRVEDFQDRFRKQREGWNSSSAGQMKLVEFLLEVEESQGFIKKRTFWWALPLLYLKTQKSSAYTVKERLETKDWNYKTPLSWAAYSGVLEMVSLLVEKGADVNTYDMDKQTPLYYAVSGSHVNVVQFLINSGADVNACNTFGDSPISVATKQGNVDLTKLLLDKGADVNTCDYFGASLIFAAARDGNVDIVRLLMGKGADVNACNDIGESLIFAAARGGNVDIVRLLMDKGADVNACDTFCESPIFQAARGGNVDIVRLLMDEDTDVNACNLFGSSLIFAAVTGGNVDIVRFLINKGADVNACKNFGERLIFTAAQEGNVDILRLLMDKGADVNACNNIGESPILAAARRGNVDIVRLLIDKGTDVNACVNSGERLIVAAASGGNVDIVRLLIGKGADVNACSNIGESPIFVAAERGDVDIVSLLMDKGADVNACSNIGESPIFAAARRGNVDILSLLLDKGADVNACNVRGESPIFAAVIGGNVDILRLLMDKVSDVNACNNIGESPLLAAATGGNLDIVSLLLDKGADVNSCNNFGKSPILAAAEIGNVDIVSLLMNKGADVNVCKNFFVSLIFAAAKRGNVDIVRLLMDKGVDVKACADVNACTIIGESPIFAAASGGNVDIVSLLVDKGADVNACNYFGESPIFSAARGVNVDIWIKAHVNIGISPIFAAAKEVNGFVRLLMDKGADVNACNNVGETPIFVAARGGNVDLRLVMDKGADVIACNYFGESLIFAAAKGCSMDIVSLLMDKGADVNACNNVGETPIFVALKEILQGQVTWSGKRLLNPLRAPETMRRLIVTLKIKDSVFEYNCIQGSQSCVAKKPASRPSLRLEVSVRNLGASWPVDCRWKS